MTEEKTPRNCLACKQDSGTVPLIGLEYRGHQFSICPQHLPMLIHEPHQLIGKLPGAENLHPADIHDK